MINVTVKGRDVQATPTRPITSGSVGLPVTFKFTDEWDGLAKIAVFRGSGVDIDVALFTEECVVPAECLVEAGDNLWVGIYGASNDGTVVIPTIWGKVGHIYDGTELSGVDPSAPTPSWVAQVQNAVQDALDTAQSVRDDADAGLFDGEDGVSPTAAVTDITGGHRFSVTDVNGTTTVDIMDGIDGQDGQDGEGVPLGGTAGQVLVKSSGTDFDTEWTTLDADDVGAIEAPDSASNGDVLTFDDGEWIAAPPAGGADFFGVCTTSAATAAKTVSITGFTSADLVTGTKVTVKFNYGNTNDDICTLNVSETGAKTIMLAYDSYVVFGNGSVLDLVYDSYGSGSWNIVGIRQQTGSNSFIGLCESAANEAAKTVTIFGFTAANLAVNTRITVHFPNGNSCTDWTLNINNTGETSVVFAALGAYSTFTGNSKLDMVYRSGRWEIVGARATTQGYGSTILYAGTDSTSTEMAAAACAVKAVKDMIPAVPAAATAAPSNLAPSAAVGSSAKYAREDHVHKLPLPGDIGAVAEPMNPVNGNTLVYEGGDWLAQTLDAWDVGAVAYPSGQVPDGDILVFREGVWEAEQMAKYGAYYGTCTTMPTVQQKEVTVDEALTVDTLITGTRVLVRFQYGQSYDGAPTLKVNDISAMPIRVRANSNAPAGNGEWHSGQIVEFVYYDGAWIIENGMHATTSIWGKTRLGNGIADYGDGVAASASLVRSENANLTETWLWDGMEHYSSTLVNTTTPAASSWGDPGITGYLGCILTWTDLATAINANGDHLRVLKITLGDYVLFAGMKALENFDSGKWYYDPLNKPDAYIELHTDGARITAPDTDAGTMTFKVELYDGKYEAGYVTYPPLKDALAGKIDDPATKSSGQYLKYDGSGWIAAAAPGGGGGTSDYTDLTNKPSINSVTLSGNKTASDLGLIAAPGSGVNDDQVLSSSSGSPAWKTPTIELDTTNAVGTAVVGTAETDEPTFTPSGAVAVGIDYSYSNYKLVINGFTASFNGVDIKLKHGFEEDNT